MLPKNSVAVLFAVACATIAAAQTIPPGQLAGMKWRNIGPFRGGRVSAVAGVVSQPDTYYIGLPQGGVWKTTSAGQTWYPVFDAVKEVCSVGSVQVAPSDPNVVYAGTGEISGNGRGKGVYRSSDAGKTWQHVGLEASQLVPSLLVDPRDSNLVLAAALGNESAASDERGVFRSTDGGKTWTKTLFIDQGTGIQHLAWAYDDPKVIIASSERRFRGAGSGGTDLYKSTDEGLTWTKLPRNGLPNLVGRICVAVAQGTNAQRMFVIGTFGFYRSDDGGSSWRRMAADDSRIANGQGNYTSGVYVDPKNPDIVYTLATCVYRSLDGGKTFEGFKGAPGGDDPQQLWIDPVDPTHILLGGDQGAVVSMDSGQTWGSWYNQPTGQLYHLSVDNQFPYWVYATQQDSGCIGTSSRGNLGQINPFDWIAHPGMEAGYIVVDPLDPKVSYAPGPTGGIIKVTYPAGDWVQMEPNMAPGSGFRGFGEFAFSRSDPHELIFSFQCLVATTDGGVHWKRLSPDLTAEPAPVPVKGKTSGSDIPVTNGVITSFSTTPADRGILWAGTSNGIIKLSRDHGGHWEDVSLSRKPGVRGPRVLSIEASQVEAATAYALVVVPGKHGQVFRTHDYGKTWQALTNTPIPDPEHSLISMHTDPKRAGLLFLLSSSDVFASVDDGEHWQSLNLNLPTTELSDMVVHGDDLVLSTYGRGIWILDDFSPLREMTAACLASSVHLFKPADAYRVRRDVNGDTPIPPEVPHAANPPLGTMIDYSLAEKPSGPVTLEILDKDGNVVRHFSNAPVEPYDDPPPLVPSFWVEVRKPMPAEAGLNRITWDLRYDTPPAFDHNASDVMAAIPGETPQAIEGPLALPGTYTARLTVDGKSFSQAFTVKKDPRSSISDRDLEQLHALQMNLYAGIQEAFEGYRQAVALHAQVSACATNDAEVAKAVSDFSEKLAKVQGTASHTRRFYGAPSPTSFVGLNGNLLAQLENWDFGDRAPTDGMLGIYGWEWTKIKTLTDSWRTLSTKDLATLNAILQKHGMTPLAVVGPTLVDPPAPDKRYLPKAAPAK